MPYSYMLSRIVREKSYEKWFYYISLDGEVIRSDAILIFFKEDSITMYIVSFEKIDEDDFDYYSNLVGLTHDIGADEEIEYVIDVKHVFVPSVDDYHSDVENFEKTIEDVCRRERTKYS